MKNKVDNGSYRDMFWYNEGRWQEFPYFIKHFIKNIFTKNRYYKIRYGKFIVFLRNK